MNPSRRPNGTLMVLLTLFIAALLPNLFVPSVAQAAGTITGTAFRDFNANGVKDTNDPGLSGITVTAYDGTNTPVGSTTTRDGNGVPSIGALGTYSLTTTDAGTGPYRIEFTNWPSYLQPGPSGTNSGTTVQFVSSGATNVSVGFASPADFCGNAPRIAVACFPRGDTSGVTDSVIYDYDYSANGTGVALNTGAEAQDAGTTYGLAYQRSFKRLYASAYLRRGSAFGSADSTGAIYVVDNFNPALVVPFIDLNTIPGIATGANPHPRGVGGYNWNVDTAAYSQIGKIGIGDLDISDDEQTLYAVNLNQKTVVVIPFGPGATAPAAASVLARAVPTPADCPAADLHPFGLKYHDNALYVGAVCSAQSTNILTDLHAYVFRFDPTSNTFTPTPIFEFNLNYPRNAINQGFTGPNGDGEWNPWNDNWNPTGAGGGSLWAYPQPMLTDIEFDDQGFMMLGFRDRLADQAFDSGDPGPVNGPTFTTRQGGDLLLACVNGVGAWQLENAGNCGTRTTNDPNSNVGGSNEGAGPGNREFYYQENYNPFHNETGLGSLALLPGSGEILSTVYDTFNTFENGVSAFSNTNGSRNRAVQLYAPNTHFGKAGGLGDIELICDTAPIEIGNRVWNDSNHNGIQDPGEPPIAGVTVQLYDAGGTLVPGATAVTDASGNYSFSSAVGTTTTSARYGLNIQPTTSYTVRLNNAANYTAGPLNGLALTSTDADPSLNGDSRDSDGVQAAVNDVRAAVTTGAAGANTHTYDFGFALPPVSVGNQVWYDTDNNGQINGAEVGVDGVVVNLFLDTDGDGTLTGAEQTPVAVQTTTSGGYYLFTQTTSLAGVGTGTPLDPGKYIVGIPASNFTGAGVLAGSRSSGTSISNAGVVSEAAIAANGSTDSDADNADDGTTQTAGFYAGGVLSGQLTVTASGEPGGATPSHPNTVDGTAGGAAIPNANINRTVDFGFYRQTLGNLVFHDVANNGTFDGADVALAGATVRLYAQNGTTEIPVGPDGILGTADDALGGVTTLAAGTYLFQNLPQGQYVVKVTPPAGYSSSSDIASSAAPNGNVDNDDNGVGGGQGVATSAPITLTPGSSGPSFPNNVVSAATGSTVNPTLDFGFYTLSLGNLVWNDLNNNGRVDGVETGINGVTVNLFVDINGNGVLDAADTPAGTQSTSNSGHYLFTGLAPGQYLVQLDPTNFQGAGVLAGYRSSNGTNGALSGPFEPVAAAGTTDNDDNGTTGAGGLATAGRTGGIVSSVITVVAGGAPITEADLALPTAITDPAVNANSNLSIDFGVFQPAALGDFVWIDTDKNGVQDVTEPGVDGVQVSLYTANGADGIPATADDALPIATVITGDDPSTPGVQLGFYRFDNLTPNTVYTIRLDRAADFTGGGPLVGYSVTKNDQGGNDGLDSDATLLGGVPTISATTGAPGSYTPTYDFGFNTGAALGDYVWLDANNNGVQDPSEVGINGVTVRLYDGATLVDTTVTAPSGGTAGYYRFTSLDLNKTYTVRLDNPADYAPGSPLAGLVLAPQDAPAAGDAADSDASLVGAPIGSLTGTPTIVSAPTGGAGSDTPTYDFGFYKPIAALGDYVWLDANKNGVQDVGETGINSVTVRLYDGATLVGTTVTATNGSTPGFYQFANLEINKTYTIKLDNPADYAPGGPLANMRLTPVDGGADDAKDSDALLVGGFPTISAAPTGGDLSDTRTYDVGFYQPLSLGNLIWNDLNNNGIKDASEAGVDGVTVNLYIDTDGSGTLTAGDTLAGTATTSNGGHYLFTDLGKGSYLVQIAPSNFGTGAPLAGYASSTGTYGVASGPYEPGAGGTSDNDDNGTTLSGGIVSGLINLMAGTQPTSEPDGTLPNGISDAATDNSSNLTVDFGVFRPASLGNIVWYDDNKDGMKAPSEKGVPNVTVTLYDLNGTPVATVTTDSNGAYQFVNLPPGSYTVGFTNLPKNFTFTTPKQGGDDANDSDVDLATGRTAAVTLVPGQNYPMLYAGIVPQTPTAITLSRFTAIQQAGGNIIAWTTSAEVNTWGFHLYRSSTSSRADAERVTSQIILATGRGAAGTAYRWADSTAQAGVRYSYWLQEVEVGGATNEYGPATLGATAAPSANTAQTVRVFLPMISH